MTRFSERRVTAVLGPTNTGKTYLAIDRMLGHEQFRTGLPRDGDAKARFEAFVAEKAPESAAVIVEPLVQGAGGMIFHSTDTLKAVREACDRHGLLLILDEIMTGLGRLGTMFACALASRDRAGSVFWNPYGARTRPSRKSCVSKGERCVDWVAVRPARERVGRLGPCMMCFGRLS